LMLSRLWQETTIDGKEWKFQGFSLFLFLALPSLAVYFLPLPLGK